MFSVSAGAAPSSTVLRATGRLTLTLNALGFYRIRHQWSDTARESLEDNLGEIVMTIESAPNRRSEERQARHLRELQEARDAHGLRSFRC
jgi:hypothetical protein